MRPSREPVRTELVFDVVCAASYLTFARLIRVIDHLFTRGRAVDLSFLPFELRPGASTVGRPVLDELRESAGPGADLVAAATAREAAREGLILRYDRAIATGTFAAHRLVMVAYQQGMVAQTVERLFRAHFTDGLHVGDADTLRRLADEVGVVLGEDVDAELVRRLELVRSRGITVVPVLILDGQPVTAGVQSTERLLAVFDGWFAARDAD